jgi:predicted nucleic acid-binding protein
VIALYLETSAVLTWLLGESRADQVRKAVQGADAVVSSSLMFAEAERALVRAESDGLMRAVEGQRLRGALQRAGAGWTRMAVSEEVLARVSRPFPVEPVRTLDAIHLATALVFSRVFDDVRVLSFDRRILDNAGALGIRQG